MLNLLNDHLLQPSLPLFVTELTHNGSIDFLLGYGNLHVELAFVVIGSGSFLEFDIVDLFEGDVDAEDFFLSHDWVEDDGFVFDLDVLEDGESFDHMAPFQVSIQIAFKWQHQALMFDQKSGISNVLSNWVDDPTTGQEDLDRHLLLKAV